jgi:hypothetical protein
MDRHQFDAVTRLFANRQSRRAAIAALIGGALVSYDATATLAARKGKQRKGRSGKRRLRAQQVPASCFKGTSCNPGPGAYIPGCDFGETNQLENVNCTKCNAAGINLRNADASGVSFKQANLQNACLVGADLTGGNLSAANLVGVTFCRTTMPDGSTNNAGCSKSKACCPTCIEIGDSCGAGIAGACCGTDSACRATIKEPCNLGSHCCTLEGGLCDSDCVCCDDLVCTLGVCQSAEP